MRPLRLVVAAEEAAGVQVIRRLVALPEAAEFWLFELSSDRRRAPGYALIGQAGEAV